MDFVAEKKIYAEKKENQTLLGVSDKTSEWKVVYIKYGV